MPLPAAIARVAAGSLVRQAAAATLQFEAAERAFNSLSASSQDDLIKLYWCEEYRDKPKKCTRIA